MKVAFKVFASRSPGEHDLSIFLRQATRPYLGHLGWLSCFFRTASSLATACPVRASTQGVRVSTEGRRSRPVRCSSTPHNLSANLAKKQGTRRVVYVLLRVTGCIQNQVRSLRTRFDILLSYLMLRRKRAFSRCWSFDGVCGDVCFVSLDVLDMLG